MKLKSIWQKILVWLRVMVPPAGLEIDDHEIRWCRLDGAAPRMVSVKVSPGVLQDGKIINRAAFLDALREVRKEAIGANAKGIIGMVVTVVLDAAPTFMRLFELPAVDQKRLEEAVALNLRMVSPGSTTETAVGWQVLYEDKDRGRVEIGGLFVAQALVNDMVSVVREAGFVIVAMESKAVSLARVIARGDAAVDPKGNYVVIFADDAGLDFFVVRSGVLCFEYATPWRDIEGEQGDIAPQAFIDAVTRGFRQIMNFYRLHWPDLPGAILLGVGDLFDTVQATISKEIAQPITPLTVTVNGAAIGSPVACGAALRPTSAGPTGQEITFLGTDAADLYQEQKLLVFLQFWRTILPIVFGVIILAVLVVDLTWFKKGEATAAAAVPSLPPTAASQLAAFASSTATFNQSVAFISAIESSSTGKTAMITAFQTAAASSAVSLSRVTLGADGETLTFYGTASTENAIIVFKNALASSSLATNLALPLSGIQTIPQGYEFTMTGSRP